MDGFDSKMIDYYDLYVPVKVFGGGKLAGFEGLDVMLLLAQFLVHHITS